MADDEQLQPPAATNGPTSNKPVKGSGGQGSSRRRNPGQAENKSASSGMKIENKNDKNGLFTIILSKVWSEVAGKFAVTVSVVFLGILGVIFTWFVSYANNVIDDRVRNAVKAEIDKSKDSEILKSIMVAVKQDITSQKGEISDLIKNLFGSLLERNTKQNVGALSTGQFSLDDLQSVHSLSLFLPPYHSAKLYIKVTNLQKGDVISINAANGNSVKIEQSMVSDVGLDKLLGRSLNQQTQLVQEIVNETNSRETSATPLDGYFAHIHTLRFQIAPSSRPSSRDEVPNRTRIAGEPMRGRSLQEPKVANIRQFDVQYLLIVTPTINLKTIEEVLKQ